METQINRENDEFEKFLLKMMFPTNNRVPITEEQMIDLDKYHVKVLTDIEQNMLKQYMETQPKNDDSIFSFFNDLYDKIPRIVLCLNNSFEDNLNDIINKNTISILIPSIRKYNRHIIESFPKSVYKKNLIYNKRVTMLFPVIEETNTFSFSFEHLNMKNYSDKHISTFGLNQSSHIQYNIDNSKMHDKIVSYLQKLL